MDNNITLTIVLDNIAGPNLQCEHGYSLHIQTPTESFLLDCGQSPMFAENAKTLRLDLEQLKGLIISHGHYDHTGGINELMQIKNSLHFYMHPDGIQKRYSLDGEPPRSVHIRSQQKNTLLQQPAGKIHNIENNTEISPNLWLTGEVPRNTSFEDTGGSFFLDKKGLIPDPLNDDLSVWMKTKKGLVICLGCCHSGIINTINYITKVSGETNIDTIIGGMHLVNASEERLEKTVQSLNTYSIRQIVACHCSGKEATDYLQKNVRIPVHTGKSGLTFIFQNK